MNDSHPPLPFPPPGGGGPKKLIMIDNHNIKDFRVKLKTEGRQCPLTREPLKECYCSDMGSQKVQASIDFCGGAYNACEIYNKMQATEHILIIDHEPKFSNSIANSLGKAGYKTSEAVSGEDALALLKAGKFDLLLIDLQMPASGMELIEKIKGDGISLPMIAMSGVGGKGQVAELIHRGCTDFLYKPIEPEDLVKRIRHIFEKT